jgi:hypothetical protein
MPETLDIHLSWTPLSTPFISFFSSWARAVRWRKWLIEKNARNVVIIAVWLKDESRVDMHMRSPSRFATLKVRQGIRGDGLNAMKKSFLFMGHLSRGSSLESILFYRYVVPAEIPLQYRSF